MNEEKGIEASGNEIANVKDTKLTASNVFSDADSFNKLYTIGKYFAGSNLVPDTYQGKTMDCAIAVDMANRMGVSPMMVMQNLYVVKGKPTWSGQACMSMIKSSSQFTDVDYEWSGTEKADNWGCRVVAKDKNTGKIIKGSEITIQMAKDEGWYAKNPKWKNMPQQMLMYRAAAFFARSYIPNNLMGCSVEGEPDDISTKYVAHDIYEKPAPAKEHINDDDAIEAEAKEIFK